MARSSTSSTHGWRRISGTRTRFYTCPCCLPNSACSIRNTEWLSTRPCTTRCTSRPSSGARAQAPWRGSCWRRTWRACGTTGSPSSRRRITPWCTSSSASRAASRCCRRSRTSSTAASSPSFRSPSPPATLRPCSRSTSSC